jgi:hypothetical protein
MRRELRRQRIRQRPTADEDLSTRGKTDTTTSVGSLPSELFRRREEGIARVAELASAMEKEIALIADIDNVLEMFVPDHVRWRGAGVGNVQREQREPRETTTRDGQTRVSGMAGSGRDTFFGNDDRSAVIKAILAGATRPLTSTEIAEAYIGRKNVRLDGPERTRVTSRISAILSRLRERRVVAHLDNGERMRTWFLL